MPKMPVVTCSKCGQSFSALRAECPYCGKRRTIGGDKPVYQAAPAKRGAQPLSRREPPPPRRMEPIRREPPQRPWQLAAGLALIAAGVLAVLLMVFAARSDGKGISLRHTPSPTPVVTMQPRPTPSPTPTPTCDNVKVFYLTYEITPEAGGFTMYVGDAPLTLSARAYPNDKLSDARFTWRVSDSSKAKLTPSADTQSCEIEVLESAGGSITLSVSCYGYTAEIPFYIWEH